MENSNRKEQNSKSETEIKNDNNNIRGALTYEDKVIQKIVGLSIGSIDGLLTVDGGFFSNIAEKIVNTNDETAGVGVEVGRKQVAVDLSIVAEYGKNIAEIYEEIKKIVAKQVSQMTELEVVEVNVDVTDIKTREQYEKDAVSLEDRVTSAAGTANKTISEQSNRLSGKMKNTAEKVKKNAENNSEPRVE